MNSKDRDDLKDAVSFAAMFLIFVLACTWSFEDELERAERHSGVAVHCEGG